MEITSWVLPMKGISGYSLARQLGRAIRKALAGKTFESDDGSLTIDEITEESTSTNPPDHPSEMWSVDSTFSLLYTETPDDKE